MRRPLGREAGGEDMTPEWAGTRARRGLVGSGVHSWNQESAGGLRAKDRQFSHVKTEPSQLPGPRF